MVNVAPAEGPIGATPIEVTPPAAGTGYPRAHTVPPRPQLSYSVEQRRAIVEGLISDRENARYTGQLVRYRTGQTDLPPPPRPVALPEEEDVGGLVAAAPPELPEPTQQPPGVALADVAADEGRRRLSEADTELDDASLSKFIRDMVRDSGPPVDAQPDLLTPPPAATQPATSTEATVAPEPERERAGGFLSWLGGLFAHGETLGAPGTADEEGTAPPRPIEEEQPPTATAEPAAALPAGSDPQAEADPAEPMVAAVAVPELRPAAPWPAPGRAELERLLEPPPPAPRESAQASE